MWVTFLSLGADIHKGAAAAAAEPTAFDQPNLQTHTQHAECVQGAAHGQQLSDQRGAEPAQRCRGAERPHSSQHQAWQHDQELGRSIPDLLALGLISTADVLVSKYLDKGRHMTASKRQKL